MSQVNLQQFPFQLNKAISLCLLTQVDAAELFHVVESNRAYLRAWLPWLDLTKKPADSEKFIHECVEQYTTLLGFALAVRFNGKIIGMISYNKIDSITREAEIGYWLDEKQQGKGIITQACHFLVNFGFSELNIQKINVFCAVNNIKSRAIPERLGFQGTNAVEKRDHYGVPLDHVKYELMKVQ